MDLLKTIRSLHLRTGRRDTHRWRLRQSGQSLVELALIAPLFILMFCYAIDIGYFFFVLAGLESSAHNSTLYSIQGFNSVAGGKLPTSGGTGTASTVASLALGDISGFLNSTVSVAVYVCSLSNVTKTHTSQCQSYNSAPAPSSIDADPESPLFTANRVDVYYTISPPITLGGLIPTSAVPTQFHRFVEMRSLN